MKAKFTVTQKITFSAMLLVLAIFSTMVFKLVFIPGLPFVRFSLTPAIIIYSSLTLGPLYGAIVGVGADLIPALIEPFASGTGGDAINPLITIVYGLLGILPWALRLLTKHLRGIFKRPWIVYALLALSLGALAGVFYGTTLLDAGLGPDPFLVKSILLGLFFLLDIGLAVGLHFTDKFFQKRLLDLTDIPSPNEIAFIAVICEFALMATLKSLAFYVYYTWMSSGGYLPLYTYLFSSLLFASSPNILLNTFSVSWMLMLTRHFIHSYGYPTIKEQGGVGDAAQEADQKAFDEGMIVPNEDDDPLAMAAQKKAKIGWIIFFSVMIILMVACIIVITVLKP